MNLLCIAFAAQVVQPRRLHDHTVALDIYFIRPSIFNVLDVLDIPLALGVNLINA